MYVCVSCQLYFSFLIYKKRLRSMLAATFGFFFSSNASTHQEHKCHYHKCKMGVVRDMAHLYLSQQSA